MSGGAFDYDQYKIRTIYTSIQSELDMMGKPKEKSELYSSDEYYKKHPDELLNYIHPPEVVDKMLKAIEYLKIAEVYAHRIDWYLSGDDGDESFLTRLENDLKKL